MSLSKLNPVLDGEGILRVGGRLENAAISYDAKHQIILPYRHHVTNLIIQKYHQEAGHLGQEYALSSLRQLYWIIKGRSAVRRVLSECFLCRKLGAARGEQLMANLPKERLTPENPPFTSVGVDYFGPLYVQQGRSHVKRYSCVFTSAVYLRQELFTSRLRAPWIQILLLTHYEDSSVSGETHRPFTAIMVPIFAPESKNCVQP